MSKTRQFRLRWLWITISDGVIIWLCIGGRKPLAHLPRWKRHLFHLPAIRWRLWPKPWNFNGPIHKVYSLNGEKSKYLDDGSYFDPGH